jgi:hypothetical protein
MIITIKARMKDMVYPSSGLFGNDLFSTLTPVSGDSSLNNMQ